MMTEQTLETTLGDLIVALTAEATRNIGDQRQEHQVVALALRDLLNDAWMRTRKWQ